MINLEGLPTTKFYNGEFVLDMRAVPVGTVFASPDGRVKIEVVLNALIVMGISSNHCEACVLRNMSFGPNGITSCTRYMDDVMRMENRTACFLYQDLPRVFAFVEGYEDARHK